MANIRVLSLNMHKGMNAFNRRLTVHRLASLLKDAQPDLIFLQEVQGEHRIREDKWIDWPNHRQDTFLANHLDLDAVYGGNAFYPHGHHGNALISAFPLIHSRNVDISQNKLEQRGMLHCIYQMGSMQLHAICVHLNLLANDRKKQLFLLMDEIHRHVPFDAPLILAGDFNDWRNEATHLLLTHAGLHESTFALKGRLPKTFPAGWPMLSLDRIYFRHLKVQSTEVGDRLTWRGISDHLPLSSSFDL
ncbi:endonuclease/exonuclease/phosphatase family protein [Leeia sp. TBRC 13508]|uniref:Endonuclease/exonuclease/phosphatase family protein n=1 Tax=Leeia speluncae TaxID=2884804 RepID=A0ABS8D7T1_9NEIS|nr:endonuclease/exonuclease/phosphatase family protein [Leeia speluncae]MCB6184187.1 endonuclease/exonuclease/phosphatase family protein [Leeia speluncae]